MSRPVIQPKPRHACSTCPSIADILETVLRSMKEHGQGPSMLGSEEDRQFLRAIEEQLVRAKALAKKVPDAKTGRAA